MTLMIAPVANKTFATSLGNSFTSDQDGIIRNVSFTQDVTDLQAAGCRVISFWAPDLLFYGKALNFNSSADQQLNQTAWTGKFRPSLITVTNASVSLTTAAGGVYSAAAKGGTAIVAAGQAYIALTAALLALDLTLNSPATVFASGTPVFLSLTTPQGGAATADINVYGKVYS